MPSASRPGSPPSGSSACWRWPSSPTCAASAWPACCRTSPPPSSCWPRSPSALLALVRSGHGLHTPFQPLHGHGPGDLLEAVALGVFLYSAFEWVTTSAEEVRKPASIHRGMLIAVGILCVVCSRGRRGHEPHTHPQRAHLRLSPALPRHRGHRSLRAVGDGGGHRGHRAQHVQRRLHHRVAVHLRHGPRGLVCPGNWPSSTTAPCPGCRWSPSGRRLCRRRAAGRAHPCLAGARRRRGGARGDDLRRGRVLRAAPAAAPARHTETVPGTRPRRARPDRASSSSACWPLTASVSVQTRFNPAPLVIIVLAGALSAYYVLRVLPGSRRREAARRPAAAPPGR